MADRSAAAVRLFELGFGPWRRRRLRGPLLAGLPADPAPELPLILVANHTSWWDPFILREVQQAIRPGAPLFSVMLERELRRRPLLRRLGAVGIDPASPASLLRCFRRLKRARAQCPHLAIAYFPQGRIVPAGARLLFQRGIETLVRAVGPAQLLPVGIRIEPMERVAPLAMASVGAPVDSRSRRVDAASLEASVAAELQRIAHFLEEHGEHTVQRWPAELPMPAPAWW